jgi:hypothetical protein
MLSLLLLDTAPPVLLRALNRRLVALDLARAHAHEAGSGLEGALQITRSGLAKHVDLDEVRLQRALDGEDRLDQEGVGVLEVQVHDTHHADAHELRAEAVAQLLLVVLHDGGRHGARFVGRAHLRGLDVFERSQVCSQSIISTQVIHIYIWKLCISETSETGTYPSSC